MFCVSVCGGSDWNSYASPVMPVHCTWLHAVKSWNALHWRLSRVHIRSILGSLLRAQSHVSRQQWLHALTTRKSRSWFPAFTWHTQLCNRPTFTKLSVQHPPAECRHLGLKNSSFNNSKDTNNTEMILPGTCYYMRTRRVTYLKAIEVKLSFVGKYNILDIHIETYLLTSQLSEQPCRSCWKLYSRTRKTEHDYTTTPIS